jgi:hypothetical protein
VSLFSWDYESDHPADEWFRLAHAYADASVALFESIEASQLPQTFHHAKVAAAMFDQGLELFLKAALVLAGEQPVATHKMAALLGRVRSRYPSEACSFTGNVDEAVQALPTQPVGQFLRYPVDRNGAPWPGHSHFDLAIWLPEARLLRDDYRRLEPLLRAARSARAQ